MEVAKLTLRPTKEIIELARQMAEEDNTSITQMFSAFILSRQQLRMSQMKIKAGPLSNSVIGILNLPEDWDYKNDMADILDEKYAN